MVIRGGGILTQLAAPVRPLHLAQLEHSLLSLTLFAELVLFGTLALLLSLLLPSVRLVELGLAGWAAGLVALPTARHPRRWGGGLAAAGAPVAVPLPPNQRPTAGMKEKGDYMVSTAQR